MCCPRCTLQFARQPNTLSLCDVAAPPDTALRSRPRLPPSLARASRGVHVYRDVTMDSNSDSTETVWPKLEIDFDDNSPSYTSPFKQEKVYWTSENTMKLIELLKECTELWDSKNLLYKDRKAKSAKSEYLANIFSTTPEEISRKIHNLRTQLNNELRKIKKRQSTQADGNGTTLSSKWEYFDALAFLMPAASSSPETFEVNVDAVNLELAEFQAEEEEAFGAAARANRSEAKSNASTLPVRSKMGRVAPPATMPANTLYWNGEELLPILKPGINADESQIFGDFVASELRTLRSDESRKRLKRIIQKAILQIGEEEDVNMNGPM